MVPLFILMILLNPIIIGILVGIIGIIFCLIQQKKHKTKLGRIGIILNSIGIIISIVMLIILIKYLVPIIQSQLQNFPAI